MADYTKLKGPGIAAVGAAVGASAGAPAPAGLPAGAGMLAGFASWTVEQVWPSFLHAAATAPQTKAFLPPSAQPERSAQRWKSRRPSREPYMMQLTYVLHLTCCASGRHVAQLDGRSAGVRSDFP